MRRKSGFGYLLPDTSEQMIRAWSLIDHQSVSAQSGFDCWRRGVLVICFLGPSVPILCSDF